MRRGCESLGKNEQVRIASFDLLVDLRSSRISWEFICERPQHFGDIVYSTACRMRACVGLSFGLVRS